ncbi:MAG: hypothetical protein VXW32_09245 [Myxococcota bacterium]|nr:hypothetical protein [Myxococcota bacterium]
MKRAHIEGLRKSDPITLSVLVQDLVRKPLVGLDTRSLSDLFALADQETLPVDLLRDLRKFREQMLREIADLPDGHVLQDWLEEFLGFSAERVPGVLRAALIGRSEDSGIRPDTLALLERVESHFAQQAAAGVEIVQRAVKIVQKGPDVLSPEERKRRRAATGAKRVPRTVADPAREKWIRADVLERLENYGSRGLKQAMLVAGSKHRSPWEDLKDAEILAVLRDLERSGKVQKSTNRWAIKGRW